MKNYIKGLLKLALAILLICIYYSITLVLSAYLLSMFEKNLFTEVANDWKAANEKLSTHVISENTKEAFKSSISVNISNYVDKIINNEAYRNSYLFISTMLLLIIGVKIYLSRLDKQKQDNNKQEGKADKVSSWLSIKDILDLIHRNVLSENDGIILGQYQKNSFSKIITLPSTGRINKNILLIGNSGSGKSRAFVKSNIINLSKDWHSFVISDPKGEYLNDTAEYLNEKGYDIKILNLVNIKNSHRWNPMDYVSDAIDAQYVSELIIDKVHKNDAIKISKNTEKIEKELIKNLIIYIKDKLNKNVQNLNTLYNILSTFKAKEIDELLMYESDLEQLSEYMFYLKQTYDEKEVAINDLIDKLNIFDMRALSNMLKSTEIKLELPKIRPTAYFLILPDMHQELDLIASLFLAMLCKKTIEIHDDTKDDMIRSREVFLILDEFENFGYIPKFADRISQFRARKINCSIILNDLDVIKSLYIEEEFRNLINCCDTKLFYGCNDDITAEQFANILSKGVSTQDDSPISAQELLNLDIDRCIISIRGQKPAKLYKYDWTNLKGYKVINGKRQFEIAKWIKEQIANLRKDNTVKDIEPQISLYDYHENIKQELNNILYYNDYKNAPKIKVFEGQQQAGEDEEDNNAEDAKAE